MNKFGWLVLTLFFAIGVFAFWSSERHRRTEAPSTTGVFAPTNAGQIQIPVAGVTADRLVDTWQQARDNGARAHQAIDIVAPLGAPVLAAMSGRIEKLHLSNQGGTTAYIRSNDGRWLTYYAHLARYTQGLAEGQAIASRQQIGFVGDTGNAGSGNAHLHFALHKMAPGETWYQGTPVNPYPLLAGKRGAR